MFSSLLLAAITAAVLLIGSQSALADTTSWTTSPVRMCGATPEISADPGGNVYAYDVYSGMVRKYTGTGTFLGTVGSQSDNIRGLTTSSDGDVYIVYLVQGVWQISKYDGAGSLLQTISIEEGSDPGQASSIGAIGADAAGNLYVLDLGASRVEKFSNGVYSSEWGSAGDGNGQFDFFHFQGALAVAGDGTIYVADSTNRIQEFTPAGQFVTAWGGTGSTPGQFLGVTSLSVDSAGHVYAADAMALPNDLSIQEFDSAGHYLAGVVRSQDEIGGVTTYGTDLVYGYICNTVYRYELTIPDVSVLLSALAPPGATPSVYVGQPLTATVNASVPFGSIIGYAIDFGTGGPVVTGPSSTATNVYTAPGTYRVSVQVTGSRGGTATAATNVVVMPSYSVGNPIPPVSTSPPSISGSAVEGQRLSETHGGWSNGPITQYGYQWQRCDRSGGNCRMIGGATSQTYVLKATDVGHTIRVTENATGGGGAWSAAMSRQTATVKALPKLSGLSVAPTAFRAADHGNSVTTSTKVGLAVHYKLNVAASVRFTVQRLVDGRQIGLGCVAPTGKKNKARHCLRSVTVPGSFTVTGRPGTNAVRFSGRLNRGSLPPGTYRLRVVPFANGVTGVVQTARFTIVR